VETLQEVFRGGSHEKGIPALFVAVLLAAPIMAMPYSAAARPQDEKKQRSDAKYREKLYKEVRHQLVMFAVVFGVRQPRLPGGGRQGDSLRPSDSASFEIRRRGAVKSLEGVSSVVNNIEFFHLAAG